MLSYGDLRRWDGQLVLDASEELRADLRRLERARDAVTDDALPDSWTGLSKLAAQQWQRVLVTRMQEHVDGLEPFEKVVFSAHARANALRHAVDDLDADARRDDFTIDSDGTVRDVSGPRTFETPRQADAYAESRRLLQEALLDRVEKLLELAYAIDSDLVRALPKDGFLPEGEVASVVDPEVERDWAELTDDERRAVLESLTEELAELYGVDDYELIFENLEDQDGDGVDDDPTTNSFGSWTNSRKELRLDTESLDDPHLLGTVAHELRHAAQYQAVDDLPNGFEQWLIDRGLREDDFTPPPDATRAEVERWRHFIENRDEYPDYWTRPIEVDAREAGQGFLEDFTADDLERLVEASR